MWSIEAFAMVCSWYAYGKLVARLKRSTCVMLTMALSRAPASALGRERRIERSRCNWPRESSCSDGTWWRMWLKLDLPSTSLGFDYATSFCPVFLSFSLVRYSLLERGKSDRELQSLRRNEAKGGEIEKPCESGEDDAMRCGDLQLIHVLGVLCRGCGRPTQLQAGQFNIRRTIQ